MCVVVANVFNLRSASSMANVTKSPLVEVFVRLGSKVFQGLELTGFFAGRGDRVLLLC